MKESGWVNANDHLAHPSPKLGKKLDQGVLKKANSQVGKGGLPPLNSHYIQH